MNPLVQLVLIYISSPRLRILNRQRLRQYTIAYAKSAAAHVTQTVHTPSTSVNDPIALGFR